MSNMNKPEAAAALLYSAEAPTEAQRQRFDAFLARTYPDRGLTLEWRQDAALKGGFRLEVGPDIYDWSLEGRMAQLRQAIDALDTREDVLPLMRQTIEDWTPSTKGRSGSSRYPFTGWGASFKTISDTSSNINSRSRNTALGAALIRCMCIYSMP